MPIIIKDYFWQQSETSLTIKIPLKGVNKKDIDLLTSEKYIKASYPPYIFEVFLWKPIEDTKSKCFITDNEIIFELHKLEAGKWDDLELNLNKVEKVELKKVILEEIQNKAKERSESLSNQRAELKRVAVREQISIETKLRQKIEKVKKDETEKALQRFNLGGDKGNKVKENFFGESSEINLNKEKTENKLVCNNENKSKDTTGKCEGKNFRKAVPPKSAKVHPMIPQPRKSQVVTVSFTNREFPTPSRESKAEEELEWLTKQAEARRTSGFNSDDLRPEEKNPQWLKDKGDEFFKNGNYLAAVSAYSLGIKLSKNFAALYVNRSAAHMALKNLHKTVEDCSTALELMVPACQANLLPRAKCLARRGAALAKLGLLRQGADEIEAALKLVPNDKQLLEDLKEIRNQIDNKCK